MESPQLPTYIKFKYIAPSGAQFEAEGTNTAGTVEGISYLAAQMNRSEDDRPIRQAKAANLANMGSIFYSASAFLLLCAVSFGSWQVVTSILAPSQPQPQSQLWSK